MLRLPLSLPFLFFPSLHSVAGGRWTLVAGHILTHSLTFTMSPLILLASLAIVASVPPATGGSARSGAGPSIVSNLNISTKLFQSTCQINSTLSCDSGNDLEDALPIESATTDGPWSGSSVFSTAAVSVDARECASIGSSIMKDKGGNCIDSVIAVLFCMGLIIPESMGLGGGFLMTFFNGTSKKGYTIDARDIAPAYARDGMFKRSEQIKARIGIDSIAVPGELAGYWQAHAKFGSLPWADLIEPTIDLAQSGFKVGNHLSDSIKVKWNEIIELGKSGKDLLAILTNPVTGQPYQEGDVMKRPDLVKTLQIIAKEGADAMYSPNGSLLQLLIEDLKLFNSRLQMEDFLNYTVKINESPVFNLVNGYNIYSPPAPGSGEVLSFIVDVVLRTYQEKQFKVKDDEEQLSLFWSRLVEVWKFAFAQRSFLGDPAFESGPETKMSSERLRSDVFRKKISQQIVSMTQTKDDANFYTFDTNYNSNVVVTEDHGTAAVAVIDSDGNAVAVGTTVNQYFGSFVLSPQTGIVFNDGMDDFASAFPNQFNLPPSKFNRIHRGKRPMSSMAPAIVTRSVGDKEEVYMAIGGSGGTQITTSTSLVILKCILFDQNLTSAVEERRVHHQLQPNLLKFEEGFNSKLLRSFMQLNHTTEKISGRSSIIMALKRIFDTNQIQACSDSRKGGAVDGW